MKKLKYIGGEVSVLQVTINKEYEVYKLKGNSGIHIIDDFWLEENYNAEKMIENNFHSFVSEEELEECFEVIE